MSDWKFYRSEIDEDAVWAYDGQRVLLYFRDEPEEGWTNSLFGVPPNVISDKAYESYLPHWAPHPLKGTYTHE